MPRRQHVVTLSLEDRRSLQRLIRAGAAPALTQTHARILLLADPGTHDRVLTDRAIAAALVISSRTVARVRAAYCTQGLDAAVGRKAADRVYPRKLDGAGEAKLLELACGPAPEGHARWSLRLLADRLVELHVVATIHHTTVGATLKQTRCSRTECAIGVCRA